VATSPGCAFATKEALNCLYSKSHNLELDLCLSVQTSQDEQYLKSLYPNANIFYPNLSRIESLKNQSRYRSAIHSEIINQSWKMKTDAEFAIIMDNDVLLTGSQKIGDLLKLMELRQAVICGTSYPKQAVLSKLIGRKDYKPMNVPNAIFSILDLSYYKKMHTICDFSNLLLDSKNTFFDDSFPKKLQGKMIDTAANLYTQPIIDKRKYFIFSCVNTFHPYYPGSIKDFLVGGLESPELYTLKAFDLKVHHFKKISSPSFQNTTHRKKAYEFWRARVFNRFA